MEVIYSKYYLRTGTMIKRRERLPFPSSFFTCMATEYQKMHIEYLVDDMLDNYPAFFRVNVTVKPTNNIKVFIDGDDGISIEQCAKFNRQLYKLIEENGTFEGENFSLEVSSPGISEPLKMHRQYVKNRGRFVEINFTDGTTKEGKLIEVAEEDIILEQTTGKGKNTSTQQVVIPFTNIKTTTAQIKF
ncbi:MAG: ribosome maturation factor [Parafilimonas sp.]